MTRTRGMTLVELMVALAVLSLLLALALVGMRSPIERQKETAATRELEAAALRARQRAMATNQPVRLVVENVAQPNGGTRAVARWERLTCNNAWDNNSCPKDVCVNTTCRATPACCDEVGPDIILPTTVNAAPVHGLCFLPGTGRAVRPGNLGCLRGQLGDAAAIAAAAPGNLRIQYTSNRKRTLLMVEPVTGLSRLLDCDSQAAISRPVAQCTAP